MSLSSSCGSERQYRLVAAVKATLVRCHSGFALVVLHLNPRRSLVLVRDAGNQEEPSSQGGIRTRPITETIVNNKQVIYKVTTKTDKIPTVLCHLETTNKGLQPHSPKCYSVR